MRFSWSCAKSYMASPMPSYSKILDYWSMIQVFHRIIQDFQEKLRLSIDNPGFATYFWISWIIKLKNLDFHFDNPSFSNYWTVGIKILGFSSNNPSFSNDFWKSWIIKSKNLDFHFDNPRFSSNWTLGLPKTSKILDFQVLIQVFQFIF